MNISEFLDTRYYKKEQSIGMDVIIINVDELQAAIDDYDYIKSLKKREECEEYTVENLVKKLKDKKIKYKDLDVGYSTEDGYSRANEYYCEILGEEINKTCGCCPGDTSFHIYKENKELSECIKEVMIEIDKINLDKWVEIQKSEIPDELINDYELKCISDTGLEYIYHKDSISIPINFLLSDKYKWYVKDNIEEE